MRNLWHYGNTKDKTVQLIKKLFNEINQDGQFLPSQSNKVPSMDAKIIGQLIGYITAGKITSKGFDKDTKVQELKSKLHADVERLIRQSLDECKENDENALYPAHTTEAILLTLLYLKGHNQDKSFFCDYLTAVKNIVSDLTSSDDDFDEEFIQDAYGFKDCANILSELNNLNSGEEKLDYMIKNLELTLDALIYSQLFDNPTPPKPTQSNFGYKNQKERPDCFEVCFLEVFFSNLLYNSKTKCFDPGLLPKNITLQVKSDEKKEKVKVNLSLNKDVRIKLHPGLLSLITDGIQITNSKTNTKSTVCLSPITLDVKEIRQAYYDLISGHDEIEYMQTGSDDKYEILPSVKNVIALFNILYGLEAKNLDDIAQALSTDDRKISFKIKEADYEKNDTNNTNNKITMRIESEKFGIAYDTEFNIQGKPLTYAHTLADVKSDSMSLSKIRNGVAIDLLKSLKKEKQQESINYLLPILRHNGSAIPIVGLTLPNAMLMFYSVSLQDSNKRVGVGCKLLKYYQTLTDKKNSKFVANFKDGYGKLLTDLASSDSVYENQLSEKIIDLELFDIKNDDDFFSKFIQKSVESGSALEQLSKKEDVSLEVMQYVIKKMDTSYQPDSNMFEVWSDEMLCYLLEESPIKSGIKNSILKKKCTSSLNIKNPWLVLLCDAIINKNCSRIKLCEEKCADDLKNLNDADIIKIIKVLGKNISDMQFLIEKGPEFIKKELSGRIKLILEIADDNRYVDDVIKYLIGKSPEYIQKKMPGHIPDILVTIDYSENKFIRFDMIKYLIEQSPQAIQDKMPGYIDWIIYATTYFKYPTLEEYFKIVKYLIKDSPEYIQKNMHKHIKRILKESKSYLVNIFMYLIKEGSEDIQKEMPDDFIDFLCALKDSDDLLGITKYLIEESSEHIQKVMPKRIESLLKVTSRMNGYPKMVKYLMEESPEYIKNEMHQLVKCLVEMAQEDGYPWLIKYLKEESPEHIQKETLKYLNNVENNKNN